MRIEMPKDSSKLSALADLPEGIIVRLSDSDMHELMKRGRVISEIKRLRVELPNGFLGETEPGGG